jgi:hypothetical protein
MGRSVALAGLVALLALMLAGCKKPAPGQDTFEKLIASNMSIGLALGMSPDEAHAKLGKPSATEERQGGKSASDYYLPAAVTSTDHSTPQLTLTYVEGKLNSIYNRFYPEDQSQPAPPLFIEPLPGVKLGLAKGAIRAVLGAPRPGGDTDEWRFEHRDGRTITILAQYTKLQDSESELCSSLTVILGEAAVESRGETQEGPSWRDLGKDVKEGAGK